MISNPWVTLVVNVMLLNVFIIGLNTGELYIYLNNYQKIKDMRSIQLIFFFSCALFLSESLFAQSSTTRSTLQYHDASNNTMPLYGTYQIIAVSPSQIINLPSDLASIISEYRSANEEKLVKLDLEVWLRLLSDAQINSEGFFPLQSEIVVYDASLSNEGNIKVLGPCTPAISNGTAATATSLTIGNDCLTGTTCGGGGPIAVGTCVPSSYDCAFYQFEASATEMSVFIDFVASSGCLFRSTIFEDTSGNGVPDSQVSCATGSLDYEHNLTGLTVFNTYWVQVCYTTSNQGGCADGGTDGSADFCIVAMENDVPCDDCDTPCGDALGYLADPLVDDVVSDCVTTRMSPSLTENSTHTFCNAFSTPVSLTPVDVGFQVIVTSDCGGGNVTDFTWELFDASPCSAAPIQSGDLSDLIFDNLPATSNFVYCYTFTVPSFCSHFQHCPYFVGAGVPLPIELLEFKATLQEGGTVLTNWTTAVEIDNDYFTVERSRDGDVYLPIGTISGVGYSSMEQHYTFLDLTPISGWSYYRLRQTDFNGLSEVFEPVAVNVVENELDINIFSSENGTYTIETYSVKDGVGTIEVFNVLGNRVINQSIQIPQGITRTTIPLDFLSSGVYTLRTSMEGNFDMVSFMR